MPTPSPRHSARGGPRAGSHRARRTAPPPPARGGPRAGFTLLEVLVAVAVLGLLYTVLAGVAMQGLRAEGDAGRRLQASRLADARLLQIEAGLASGAPLPPLRDETEEDGFLVEAEVAPLELPLPAPPGAATGQVAPSAGTGSLLAPGVGGAPGALRRIAVRVSWEEGGSEIGVVRTTFALDPEAAKTLLQGLADQAAAEKAEREESASDRDDANPGSRGKGDGAPPGAPGTDPGSVE